MPWLTKKLINSIKDIPGISIELMTELVNNRFNLVPFKMHVFRVRMAAKQIIDGKQEDSFSRIPALL